MIAPVLLYFNLVYFTLVILLPRYFNIDELFSALLLFVGVIFNMLISFGNFDLLLPGRHRSTNKRSLDLTRIIAISFFVIGLGLLVNCIIELLKSESEPPGEKARVKGVNAYFEKIRDNEAELISFFSQMPKGGDLHNHFSGSIYAETFLEDAMSRSLWLDLNTLKIDTTRPAVTKGIVRFVRMDTLKKRNDHKDIRQRLMQDWSVKDYYEGFRPSDKHFFDAFGKFPKSRPWQLTRSGLIELKNRAVSENVQYLEIMLGGLDVETRSGYENYNEVLRSSIQAKDYNGLDRALTFLHQNIKDTATKQAKAYVDSLVRVHHSIDDSNFTMRYMVHIRREQEPLNVFKGFMGAFEAAIADTTLVVGVNIVNREDGPLSMKDYMLHMHMFKFFHKLYGKVRYSMHAGELTLGAVQPEELTWHINEAVFTAGAQRIGHGVDLPYEKNNRELLKQMREKKIAVEINLVSNEFILKVANEKHPIMLYHNSQVPIVISTDDAGILRSNLIGQFVLLAKRYKEISYADIKQFILNSIEYSFIRDQKLKERLTKNLTDKIAAFEKEIMNAVKKK